MTKQLISPAQQQSAKTRTISRRSSGCLLGLLLAAAVAVSPIIWRKAVQWVYGHQIYTVQDVAEDQVAIVFGAAVYGNGRLSSVLRDRMETAVTLYESGKINKILVSGDNTTQDYDEPSAMMAYAINRGVPAADVQPDYGGRRTYDTCFRARNIFELDSAILVTQEFHLPRAIFTCRRLGLDAIGVNANRRPYRGSRWYEIRETGATIVALWDTIRQQPPPILGDPIPIEPDI